MDSAIAIIPARWGSKRIPQKNIKDFNGKPVIYYPINTAIESNCFQKVLVSTDSENIARISEEAGATIKFMRPANLADDYTTTAEVLIHALTFLEKNETLPNFLCCIYPATPLLSSSHLIESFNLIKRKKVTSVFSIAEFSAPIHRALKINESGRITMFWPEFELTRTNDLPKAFYDAGQFYWLDTKKFLLEKRLFSSDSIGYVIPSKYIQDIDTEEDWEEAIKKFDLLHK